MIQNVIYLEQVYKVAQKSSVNRQDMNAIGVAEPNSAEIIMYGVQRKITDVSKNRIKRCEYITPAEDLVFSSLTRSIPLEGMDMYMPWGLSTMAFRYAVLFGIRKVVVHKQAMDKRRNKAFYRDINMELAKHNIEFIEYDGEIGCDFEVTVNGKSFAP